MTGKQLDIPGYGVDMNTRQADCPSFGAQHVKRSGGLAYSAHSFNEAKEIVDGEVRCAVDREMRRMLKELKQAVGHFSEGFKRDTTSKLEGCGTSEFGRLDVKPVMVGPHEREFQVFVVRGSEKSPFQSSVQERAVFIPVPIEYQRVQFVGSSHCNLLLKHLGI